MIKKSFEDWEKSTGWFAIDENKIKADSQLSEDEFINIIRTSEGQFTGVSYDDRIIFLKSNGYKINRANLIDGNLSAKPLKK